MRVAPGLRLRPVPELGTCLAFTPTPPRLHTLNPTAWLLAELCGRYDGEELRQQFLSRTVPPASEADALGHFAEGMALLLQWGIVTEEPT